MANGNVFEPHWWQTLLAGLGSTLLAWAGGRRIGRLRGIKVAVEEDFAKTAVSVEASRAEFRAVFIILREEHEEQMALMREEGHKMRGSVTALGVELARQLAQMHRDMIDRTKGGPR